MRNQQRLRLMICLLVSIASCQFLHAQDYSGYNQANKYLKEKKYLLAYKHLVIFKYSNLQYLQQPANTATLAKLDATIEQFETSLQDNVSWYKLKVGRGFTDKQTDEYLKTVNSNLKIDSLKIN